MIFNNVLGGLLGKPSEIAVEWHIPGLCTHAQPSAAPIDRTVIREIVAPVTAKPVSTPSPSLMPSNWPHETCPVSISRTGKVSVYGQVVPRPTPLQVKVLSVLIGHWEKKQTQTHKGPLRTVGFKECTLYPHRAIRTMTKKPVWEAILRRPGQGWGDGYRIEHSA